MKTFLELAHEEALAAVGVSYPNPAVGAVVVKEGKIVGCGHTQVVHGPHAEVMALRAAGENARGATLYVTLEPCCHFGRTPPCTNAIIAAGISQVYFSHRDPNPLVWGKSERILAASGIPSQFVDPPKEFALFYEAYDYFVRNKKPFVECKIAETADGFIAAADKSPLRITGEAAAIWTARWRRSAEMILVGAGTAMLDNPRLNVRGVCGNSPRRIVFGGQRTLSPELRLFDDPQKKTLVFSRDPQNALKEIADVHVLRSESFLENWLQMLEELSALGIHRLAVEMGATLAQNILRENLWDRLYVLRSSKTLGKGLAWRSGIEPELQTLETLESDVLLTAINPIKTSK